MKKKYSLHSNDCEVRDTENQTANIKSTRNLLAIMFFVLLLSISMRLLLPVIFYGNTIIESISELYYLLIDETLLAIIITAILLLFLILLLIGILYFHHLYKKLNSGISIDHSPKTKKFYFHTLRFLAILLICIHIFHPFFPSNSELIPADPDGPYILISDITSEIEPNNTSDVVAYDRSMLAEHWFLSDKEYYSDESSLFIYQDVYQLKLAFMSESFAKALMADSPFAESPDEFTEVKFPGLDYAWTCNRYVCVAIKGDLVYVIKYFDDSNDDITAIFQAIADKNYES